VLGPQYGPLPGTVDGPGLATASAERVAGLWTGELMGAPTGTAGGTQTGGGGHGAGVTGGWEPQDAPARSVPVATPFTSAPQTRTGTAPGAPTPIPEPMPPEFVVVVTTREEVPAEQIAPAPSPSIATPSASSPQAWIGTAIGTAAVSPAPMPAEPLVMLIECEPPWPGISPHRAASLGALLCEETATTVSPQSSTGVSTGAWTVSPATIPPECRDAPAA
jgi:hypothetical protein